MVQAKITFLLNVRIENSLPPHLPVRLDITPPFFSPLNVKSPTVKFFFQILSYTFDSITKVIKKTINLFFGNEKVLDTNNLNFF